MRRRVFARIYPRVNRAMDREGMAERRQDLLAGAAGQVVEVGAGNGATFAHYPDKVDEVLAVEPERHLRLLAMDAAQNAPVPIRVVDGTAEQIPADDGAADVVVSSLVLCSVREQPTALREIRRILRPGGQLRLLEHVRSDRPRAARFQRILDATIWPTLAGGCHTSRDTVDAVRQSGFEVAEVTTFRLENMITPTHPFVLATAVRR